MVLDPSGGKNFSVRRPGSGTGLSYYSIRRRKRQPFARPRAPERRFRRASGGKNELSDDKRRTLERQKEKRPNFFGLLQISLGGASSFSDPDVRGRRQASAAAPIRTRVREKNFCGGPDQRAGTELLQLPRSERGRPAPERGADNAFRPFGLLRREESAPKEGRARLGL